MPLRGYGPAEETRTISETRTAVTVPRLRLVTDVNHLEELIRSWPINANNVGSLPQRLVSVMKFAADRGLAFRGDDENVGSPRNLFQKNF